MLDATGLQWCPHLHEQVLLFAIIGTGSPLESFMLQTLADSRVQMAATMLPRATGLGVTPLGGSASRAPTPRSWHLSPLHSEKTAPSGASTTDAAVAQSRTGKGTHDQGIGNSAHANTVAKKAENAAAQACSKALNAMRAHKAEAQEEADATYAGLVSVHARLRCTD
jgi:hypothetical protein